MIRSLLVPLDGSELSEQGLPLASRIARASGADVHLARVHVHAPGLMVANSPFPIEGAHEELVEEEKYLNEWAERLAEQGVSTGASVLEGPRVADSLLSHAIEVGADLVLISSHGRSGIGRLWMGSVARDLVGRTHLPVFVTRPGKEGAAATSDIRSVMVVLDGSVSAESVLPPAAELARTTGARMVLVHAAVSKRDEATAYLEDVAAPLRESGLDVTTHAMFGSRTSEDIARVAAATGADVIAMTIGGRGVSQGLRPKMADEVLRSTNLPLLLVRSYAAA